jgi:hypothetical protein
MPVHEWSQVPTGLYHHFHQDWSIEIARTLNRGRLPKGFSALVERSSGPKESEKEIYASRANRIVVKHHLGRIVAVIEIVSPGNKDSRAALRDFVDKTGGERVAYIEPVTVGDELPEMPLFLTNDLHVKVPLEPTYRAT